LRPQDKSLRRPLHGTASASIQISYGSGISLHVPRHWLGVDDNRHRARPQNGGSTRDNRERRK
jgi:hypothetical protein